MLCESSSDTFIAPPESLLSPPKKSEGSHSGKGVIGNRPHQSSSLCSLPSYKAAQGDAINKILAEDEDEDQGDAFTSQETPEIASKLPEFEQRYKMITHPRRSLSRNNFTDILISDFPLSECDKRILSLWHFTEAIFK